MKILEQVPLFIDKILKRNLYSNREKTFHNFSSAETIDILFDARNDIELKVSKDFIKFLTENGKQVSALGFVDSEEKISSYLYRKGIDFIYLKNLKRSLNPKNPVIDEFVLKSPDILINLCLEDLPALRYIIGMSKAKFKISGITNDKHADFMIDLKPGKNTSYLVQQLKHYLNIIKKAK